MGGVGDLVGIDADRPAHDPRIEPVEVVGVPGGAVAAAQLFTAARRSEPDIAPGIASGDFAPLMAWLRDNVHCKASLVTTDELMRQATGEALGTQAFKRHLEARYLA